MMLENEEELINPPAATFFQMLMLAIIFCLDAIVDTLITSSFIDYSSFIVLLYPLTSTLGALAWGYFIDKYGRKNLFVKSLSMTGGCLFISILLPGLKLQHLGLCIMAAIKGHFVIGKVLVSEICAKQKRPWAISIAFGFQALGYAYGHDAYKNYGLIFTKIILGALNIVMAFIVNFEYEETLIKDVPVNRMQNMNIETPLYSDISKISFDQFGKEVEMISNYDGNIAQNEFTLPSIDSTRVDDSESENNRKEIASEKKQDSSQVKQDKDDDEETKENSEAQQNTQQSNVSPAQQIINQHKEQQNQENKPFNFQEFIAKTKKDLINLKADSKDFQKDYKSIFVGFNIYRLTAIFVLIFSLSSIMQQFMRGWLMAPEDQGGLNLIYDAATEGFDKAQIFLFFIQIFLYPIYKPYLNDYYVLCFLLGIHLLTLLMIPLGYIVAGYSFSASTDLSFFYSSGGSRTLICVFVVNLSLKKILGWAGLILYLRVSTPGTYNLVL